MTLDEFLKAKKIPRLRDWYAYALFQDYPCMVPCVQPWLTLGTARTAWRISSKQQALPDRQYQAGFLLLKLLYPAPGVGFERGLSRLWSQALESMNFLGVTVTHLLSSLFNNGRRNSPPKSWMELCCQMVQVNLEDVPEALTWFKVGKGKSQSFGIFVRTPTLCHGKRGQDLQDEVWSLDLTTRYVRLQQDVTLPAKPWLAASREDSARALIAYPTRRNHRQISWRSFRHRYHNQASSVQFHPDAAPGPARRKLPIWRVYRDDGSL